MAGFSRRPLLGAAVLEGEARVRGSLYDCGAYPAVVLDDGGWVTGELYRVPDLAALLSGLDREEGYDPADEAGSLYVRRRAPVHLGDGSSRPAWLYVWNRPAERLRARGRRIESGDWRRHCLAQGLPLR